MFFKCSFPGIADPRAHSPLCECSGGFGKQRATMSSASSVFPFCVRPQASSRLALSCSTTACSTTVQEFSILSIVPSCSYYMNTHSSLPRLASLFHNSPLVITLVIFNNVALRLIPLRTLLDQTHPRLATMIFPCQ